MQPPPQPTPQPATENRRKIRVEKQKFPAVRYYSYRKYLLRAQDDEMILWNPPGLAITNHLHGGGFYLPTQSVTWCSTRRWNNIAAVYEADGRFRFWYCDIAMPCTFDDREDVIAFVDLDLDLIAYADGSYRVDDEDEFLVHQRQYGYPPEVVARARAELNTLIADHAARRYPFDGSLDTYLPPKPAKKGNPSPGPSPTGEG